MKISYYISLKKVEFLSECWQFRLLMKCILYILIPFHPTNFTSVVSPILLKV